MFLPAFLLGTHCSFAQNATTVTVDASVSEGAMPAIFGKGNNAPGDNKVTDTVRNILSTQQWELFRVWPKHWNINTPEELPFYEPYFDQFAPLATSLLWVQSISGGVKSGSVTVEDWKNQAIAALKYYKQRYANIEWVEAGNEQELDKSDMTFYYDTVYTTTYEIVNAVNAQVSNGPALKVGGPVTAFFHSTRIQAFLDAYAADSNPAKKLDFISWHQYYFDTSNKTKLSQVKNHKQTVENWLSARGLDPTLPVFISETGIYATNKNGTYFGGTADFNRDLLVQASAVASQHYWYLRGSHPQDVYPLHWVVDHANDIKDQFPNGQDGTTSAYYNMIKMQQMMKSTRIAATSNHLTTDGVGVYGLATKDASGVAVMTWNYQFLATTDYNTTVQVNNLPSQFSGKNIKVERYLIDEQTSNYNAASGTDELELVECSVVSHSGSYSKAFTLKENAIGLIVLSPTTESVGNCLPSGGGSDLIGHYSFDNNGTNQGSAGLSATFPSGVSYSSSDKQEGTHSLNLNGTSHHVVLNSGNTSYLKDAFTQRSVAMWVKADNVSGTRIIYDEGGKSNGLALRINSLDQLEARVVANAGSVVKVTSPNTFTANTWKHIAVTYNNGTVKLYEDGLEVSSSATGFNQIPAHSNNAGLGAVIDNIAFGGTGLSNFFDGKMDDVKIYNRVLSSSEVSSLSGRSGARLAAKNSKDHQALALVEKEGEIKLYPNPVRDVLSLRLSEQESSSLKIADLNGKIVYESEGVKSHLELNTSEWINGIYLIKLSNSKEAMIYKLVVSH